MTTKKPKLIPVTVIRKEWGRGLQDKAQSYLFNPHNNLRCCMGFVCNAAGLTDKLITHLATVEMAPTELLKEPFKKLLLNSINFDKDWVQEAYQINDDRNISSTREDDLISLFRDNGFNLTFVD